MSRLAAMVLPQQEALPVTGAMLTDTGAVRSNNEDAVSYSLPAPPPSGRPGLAIVADGMGGHAAGEIASGLAIDTITRVFYQSDTAMARRFAAAFDAANDAIRAHAASVPETAGMGTTCTALAFDGGAAWLAHIGDSRAYLLRGGLLQQLSEEHSLVGELVRKGQLTAQEARDSPDKNVILRAMGLADRLQPQIWTSSLRLQQDDRLVLCSDGLSDMIDDDAILSLVAMSASPEAACRALIEAALAAGGHDNISVGVFWAGLAAPDAVPGTPPTRQTALPAAPAEVSRAPDGAEQAA